MNLMYSEGDVNKCILVKCCCGYGLMITSKSTDKITITENGLAFRLSTNHGEQIYYIPTDRMTLTYVNVHSTETTNPTSAADALKTHKQSCVNGGCELSMMKGFDVNQNKYYILVEDETYNINKKLRVAIQRDLGLEISYVMILQKEQEFLTFLRGAGLSWSNF